MNKKLMVSALLGCFLVGLYCAPPSKIEKPPVLNQQSGAIAREIVFSLKTLRIIHDVREVTDPFTFSQLMPDSLQLRIPAWDPAAINQYYQTSLAKKNTSARSLFTPLAQALAKSLAPQTEVLTRSYATAVFDTVFFRPSDSTWGGVIALDSTHLKPNFNQGTDSVFWRFTAGDTIHTDTQFVQIVRVRTDTLAQILDVQLWKSVNAAFVLFWRQQDRFNGTLRTYHHFSQVSNQIVYDSLTIASAGSTAFYYLERRDNSNAWWRSIDSSGIIVYRDSVVYPDSTRFQTLRDTASGATIDLAADTLQPYLLISTLLLNQGHDRVTDSVMADFDPATDQSILHSFYSISKTGLDSTRYWLKGIDTTAICTLLVKVTDNSNTSSDTAFFGPRTSSEYILQISRRGLWDTVRVLSYYRKDNLKTGGDAGTAEWFFAPQTPVMLRQGLHNVPGMLRVVTTAAFGDTVTRTKSRVWTRSDITTPVVYTAAWIGLAGDTVRLSAQVDNSDFRYSYNSPGTILRRGLLHTSGSTRELRDTLYDAETRVLSGTLDSNGFGQVFVSGLDSFSVQLARDSAQVIVVGGRFVPLTENFTWSIAGNQYSSHFSDSALGLRCRITASMDRSGFIQAQEQFLLLDQDTVVFSTQDLYVSPSYSGSGSILGLVNGLGNGDVATTLHINLWQDNTLGDADTFQ